MNKYFDEIISVLKLIITSKNYTVLLIKDESIMIINKIDKSKRMDLQLLTKFY